MTYNATTQRDILVFFLMMAMVGIVYGLKNPLWYYFLVPYTIYIVIALLMHFEFSIVEGSFVFIIRVLSLTLYKREVRHNEIVGMQFKRVGWGKKCVIVKNKQGFNFRIINFTPDYIYTDLEEFANEFEIPISKSKDYVILEK